MPNEQRPLKVFLCHAHSDKNAVRDLYQRLIKDGVDAWLDKEKLLPGQDWELEIRKAVREADVVVVCLSKEFNQAGFRQKEVRLALDTAMEKPEGEIFIIPARLEECDNLQNLGKWHWVDLFEEGGYEMLMRALRARADQIGATLRLKRKKAQKKNTSVEKVIKPTNSQEPFAPLKDFETSYPLNEEQAPSDNQHIPSAGVITPLQASTSEPININSNSVISFGEIRNEEYHSVDAEPPIYQSTIDTAEPSFKKPRRKSNTSIMFALIGLIGISIAGFLGLPLVEKWFFSPVSPVATATLDYATPTTKSTTSIAALFDPHPEFDDFVDDFGVPLRLISSTNPPMIFYIDKYEVTNEEYKTCDDCDSPLNVTTYNNQDFSMHPVVRVTWDMANEFCSWRGARLPTEAEWKLAAYGNTDDRVFPWGNESGCDKANYGGCIRKTSPVGSNENGVSPYGIYDMAGNVWEWINAPYQNLDNYYVLIGGSFNSTLGDLQTMKGASNSDIYTGNINDVGFRCVRDTIP